MANVEPRRPRRLLPVRFGRSEDHLREDSRRAAPDGKRSARQRDAKGTLYVVVARRNDDGSIGSEADGVLYRSNTGAEHWTRITLPEGSNGPHGLAVDPRDPLRLYLAAWGRRRQGRMLGGGVFVSTDGGDTWRHVLARDQHVYDITIDPGDPKIVYACGFESSAWRSADRGENWRRIREFNFKWGHRVIPDPRDPGKIYITTYGGGVWHGPAEGDENASEDILPTAGFLKQRPNLWPRRMDRSLDLGCRICTLRCWFCRFRGTHDCRPQGTPLQCALPGSC